MKDQLGIYYIYLLFILIIVLQDLKHFKSIATWQKYCE